MKYIKKYKIYEGKDTITTQDVRDCFNDLLDDGFYIGVKFNDGYGFVKIRKSLFSNTPFKVDDIKETLLFALPYLQEEYGLTTKDFRVRTDSNSGILSLYKRPDIFDTSSEIIYEINWVFYIPKNLCIDNSVVLNESTSVNSINWEMVEDIKDMSLEYLDDGYRLIIIVYYRIPVLGNRLEEIYSLVYDHSTNKEEKLNIDNMNINKKYIKYHITLHKKVDNYHIYDNTKTIELHERIMSAYPKENISHY